MYEKEKQMHSRQLLSLDTHGSVGREHTKSQPRKLFHISCASSPCVGREEKLSTTQVTNITAVNDDKLKETPLVESEDRVEKVIVIVKEFLSI